MKGSSIASASQMALILAQFDDCSRNCCGQLADGLFIRSHRGASDDAYPFSWLLMDKMAFLYEMLLSSHHHFAPPNGSMAIVFDQMVLVSSHRRAAQWPYATIRWSLSSSVASFNKGPTCVLMAVSSAASASTVTMPFSERNLSSVPL